MAHPASSSGGTGRKAVRVLTLATHHHLFQMMRIGGATHPLPHMLSWLAQEQVYVYLYTSLVVAVRTFSILANVQGLILGRDFGCPKWDFHFSPSRKMLNGILNLATTFFPIHNSDHSTHYNLGNWESVFWRRRSEMPSNVVLNSDRVVFVAKMLN